MSLNKIRREGAKAAIMAFLNIKDETDLQFVDYDEAVTALLTDLRHLCGEEKISFVRCEDRSAGHFLKELIDAEDDL